LKPTYINDIRFEHYVEVNQFYAISSFYKNFEDPIKFVALGLNSPNQLIGRNNSEANVAGIEIEYRKNLIDKDDSKLAVNVNTSVIFSHQEMTDAEYNGKVATEPNRIIDRTRELQGQSPFLINAGLTYTLANKNLKAGLFYNVQEKTLEVVGVGNIPGVYTDPFHNLNFTCTKKLGANQNQTITFKAQNILADTRKISMIITEKSNGPFPYLREVDPLV